MQSRLRVCAQYLSEVEEKLRELALEDRDAEERTRILEALDFVKMATDAVNGARSKVKTFPGA